MRALALAALLLCSCGGSVEESPDAGPCDKAQALADYRAAHGQTGQVGQWTVLADCTVIQVGK